MNREYREKLLALQSHIEQLIAEAEPLTVDPNGDDETSKQLTELREVLAEVEAKLNRNG